ncbi:MAG: hypothetical protein DI603_10630 [Roseateles depolymerans]|uniref:Uncharacterized protein n=1 Tax=Roseateles depolymerans TaxID=76731 RepID=A0A2W5DKR2_9BURK|nr:MAG: hypothetical protein DI603_10630 [Roseateles depolymerans]
MRAARKAKAFFSGLLLYGAAVGLAAALSSVGLPRAWYAALGGRNALPVMLGEALAIALLLVLLALPWAYFTLRPTRRRHRPYVGWLLIGVGLAWAGLVVFGAFNFAMKPRSYSAPAQTMLLSSSAAPLYGGLNILGVLAGVSWAGRLARRRHESLPSSRAQRRETAAAGDAGPETSASTLAPPVA